MMVFGEVEGRTGTKHILLGARTEVLCLKFSRSPSGACSSGRVSWAQIMIYLGPGPCFFPLGLFNSQSCTWMGFISFKGALELSLWGCPRASRPGPVSGWQPYEWIATTDEYFLQKSYETGLEYGAGMLIWDDTWIRQRTIQVSGTLTVHY